MLKYFKHVIIVSSLYAQIVLADTTINMHYVTAKELGKPAGTIQISETKYGLLFTPHLKGLEPGIHGFHIHQHPSCNENGMSAGGHFTLQADKHLGPYRNEGHLGDLPALYVNNQGLATLPVLAPRLKFIADLQHHALIIHEGGDNYSDTPEKLGGGKARMICGTTSLR